MPRVLALLVVVVSVSCNSPSLVSVHTSYSVQQQQQQSPTTNVHLESSVNNEPSHDTRALNQRQHEHQSSDLTVTTPNFVPQRFDPVVTPGPALNVRQYIQHGRQRMPPFRRPPNRRQYGPGIFLSPPFPPAKLSPGPPKRSVPLRPNSAPKPSHLIYSKPPPDVIYYGPNPPPLDHSPSSYRTRPVIHSSGSPAFSSGSAYPSGSAFSSRPAGFSSVKGTLPEDHDVMNDLDMYIPDEEASLSSKSTSKMSSMMMPLMMLGLTLPALGFMLTYLGRRRRRRDVVARSHRDQHYYLHQLNKALQKYEKRP